MELQKAKRRFNSENTEVLAASVQDLSVSQPMAQRLGVDLPIMSDKSTQVARAYGIYNLPGSMGPFSTHSFWLIDKHGVIRFKRISLEMHVPFDQVEKAVADSSA